MKNYVRYEIDSVNRKYSSNVITGVLEYFNEKGEKKEKKEPLITCFLPKKDADILINEIFDLIYKTK